MKVVGWEMNRSVSLEAIQMNLGDSNWSFGNQFALTKCHRRTESAVAQPTQDPVLSWFPIFHQCSCKSFDGGIAGLAAMSLAPTAFSIRQSLSVSRDGTQFKILLTVFFFFGIGTSSPLDL
jgi:hypothetical protein